MSGTIKPRCSGIWTEARFRSFITSNLRSATRKWKPITDCKKQANVRRGFYKCELCNKEVPATIKKNGKRVKNIHIDHIKPIVNPAKGFTTWDDLIEKMFCESDNLQALCTECHDEKTKQEREIAKDRRKREKELK